MLTLTHDDSFELDGRFYYVATLEGYFENLTLVTDKPKAIAESLAKGEPFAWIGRHASVLADDGLSMGERLNNPVKCAFGDKVKIAGTVYTLQPDYNDNVEIKAG